MRDATTVETTGHPATPGQPVLDPEQTDTDTSRSSGPPGDRADSNWSRPVDRLAMGPVPSSAININVEGRRLVGPVQGFGQLWQKRYEVRLDGADVTPEAVIAT